MINRLRPAILLAAILTGMAILPGSSAWGQTHLKGSGATFPLPYYSAIFDTYRTRFGINIEYQGVGSGSGIKDLLNGTVDFAGTDAFVDPAEMRHDSSRIVHIPTCLGGVAIAYNVSGNPQLRFDQSVISDIFLGRISKWNHPRIAAINQHVKLPDSPINVIFRSDESGTTFIFSEYLSKVSSQWKERVGTGKSVKWPVGQGAKGNAGVAGLLRQIPNSIGYVELIYALGNGMTIAKMRNKSGCYVEPSMRSISLAVTENIPADTNVSLTNTSAPEGYPISGLTWIALYKEQNYGGRNKDRAEDLVRLLWWIIHEGQKHAAQLHYAPLPRIAVKRAEKILESITYNSQPILKGERKGAGGMTAR
ncbi:MAG: Phosphate-binding protein PstS precursor [Syntrophorhabdaceae bacterium PtaU1.Bin034]|nr:MAG: Phosphate-binding protein PstS precursor [Syntrophorhabdaceae bacterium PtaU1.Bin034]